MIPNALNWKTEKDGMSEIGETVHLLVFDQYRKEVIVDGYWNGGSWCHEENDEDIEASNREESENIVIGWQAHE